ncbi:PC-esterase domain-containing protein 1A [Magallana gigas]|uniref:PC-esterase domain-containing protein 1A n=1 Tax=Magallana gigas TaxID=29159 RepID=UPI00333F95FD
MIMADIFLREDIIKLLNNKFVIIIGDSIQRAIYKDMVMLLQRNLYLKDRHLRNKGEMSFERDELIEGGRKGKMSNGVNYREIRQYHRENHLIRFYFVTRCFNTYVESILSDLSRDPKPDIILMNSCLWDISRYGKNGVEEYKTNMVRLFDRFKETLSPDCLVIWNATLPISKNIRGGFLIPEVEFMNSTLRLDILEANFFAHQVVISHGYDLLDLHYYMRNQLHRRAADGVHWDQTAHRRMTNLLLSHISEAWRQKLPGRSESMKKLIIQEESGKLQHTYGQEQRRGAVELPMFDNAGVGLREPVQNYRSPVSNLYANSRYFRDANNNPSSATAPNPDSQYRHKRSYSSRRGVEEETNYNKCKRFFREENFYPMDTEKTGNQENNNVTSQFHHDPRLPEGDRFHVLDSNANVCSTSTYAWKPYSEQAASQYGKSSGMGRRQNPYQRRNAHNRKCHNSKYV